MSDFSVVRVPALCLALVIFAMATPAALARQIVVANDPVVLPAQAAASDKAAANPAVGGPLSDTAGLKPSLPAALLESPLKTIAPGPPASLAAPSVALTSNEAKPLGRPNSPLGVRPAGSMEPKKPGMLERMDPRSNEITRVLGALAVVIGLLLLIRTILRRTGGLLPRGDRPSGVVEILARYPIARGQHFILLKFARRVLLLHQAGSSMTQLTEMTDPDEVASLLARMEAGSGERSAGKFRSALNEFVAEHHAVQDRPSRADAPLRLEAEVIDLTRNRVKSLSAMLGRPKKVLR